VRLVERYVMFYAVAILLSGLCLMSVGVQQMEIYYAVYLIEFLVGANVVASFRRSLERNLRFIILMFLLGFVYSIAQRVLQLLS
jgi:hypothetical protein